MINLRLWVYMKCEYSFGLFCWYQKANQFLPSNQTPREKIETVYVVSEDHWFWDIQKYFETHFLKLLNPRLDRSLTRCMRINVVAEICNIIAGTGNCDTVAGTGIAFLLLISIIPQSKIILTSLKLLHLLGSRKTNSPRFSLFFTINYIHVRINILNKNFSQYFVKIFLISNL